MFVTYFGIFKKTFRLFIIKKIFLEISRKLSIFKSWNPGKKNIFPSKNLGVFHLF